MMNYFYAEGAPVIDKDDFFNSGLPEAPTLRKLDSAIRRLFRVADKHLMLNILSGNSGYRFDILGSGPLKDGYLGQVFYIPQAGILDILDQPGSGQPLLEYRNKKCVLKNCSEMLQIVNIESLFNSIVSAL